MGDNFNFNTLLLLIIIGGLIFGGYYLYPAYLDYMKFMDDANEMMGNIEETRNNIREFLEDLNEFKTSPEYAQLQLLVQQRVQQQFQQRMGDGL